MPRPGETLRLVLAGEGRRLTIPIGRGEAVRVGFRHSVYGSSVEEEFEAAAGGLRLVRLRYGEARLAEFYGHEDARPADGGWIVDVPGTLHAALPLRVSRSSAMRVATPRGVVPLTDWVAGGESALVTLSVAGGESAR